MLNSNQVELDPRNFFGFMLREDLSQLEETLASDCWATSLAIALLETKYVTEKEKWEMLVEKSYLFLEKNIVTLLPHNEDDPPEAFDFEMWVMEAKKWLLSKHI